MEESRAVSVLNLKSILSVVETEKKSGILMCRLPPTWIIR